MSDNFFAVGRTADVFRLKTDPAHCWALREDLADAMRVVLSGEQPAAGDYIPDRDFAQDARAVLAAWAKYRQGQTVNMAEALHTLHNMLVEVGRHPSSVVESFCEFVRTHLQPEVVRVDDGVVLALPAHQMVVCGRTEREALGEFLIHLCKAFAYSMAPRH